MSLEPTLEKGSEGSGAITERTGLPGCLKVSWPTGNVVLGIKYSCFSSVIGCGPPWKGHAWARVLRACTHSPPSSWDNKSFLERESGKHLSLSVTEIFIWLDWGSYIWTILKHLHFWVIGKSVQAVLLHLLIYSMDTRLLEGRYYVLAHLHLLHLQVPNIGLSAE